MGSCNYRKPVLGMPRSGLVQVQFKYFPGGPVWGSASAGYLVNPVQTGLHPNLFVFET
jgi:hypothetical protein